MIKIAICDDEQIHRNKLRRQLDYYSIQKNIDFEIKEFASAEALIQGKFDFDLLFLDIYLNSDKTGIEVGQYLRDIGNNSFIVFYTSSKEFSVAGYTADAFRYLVKPISQEDITKLMDDFIKKIVHSVDRISITSNNSTYYMNLNDIIYIESISRKRFINTSNYKIATWETLTSLYSRLPVDMFLYTHKCFIVNINHVKYLSNYNLVMNNDAEITLGRKYYNDFKHKLHVYYGNNYEN